MNLKNICVLWIYGIRLYTISTKLLRIIIGIKLINAHIKLERFIVDVIKAIIRKKMRGIALEIVPKDFLYANSLYIDCTSFIHQTKLES